MSDEVSNKMNQSFPTWSFDKACQRMEWNTVRNDIEIAVKAASAGVLLSTDLSIVGVQAPVPKDDDDDDGDEDETKIPDPMALKGIAKEVDDTACALALSTVLEENAKSFQNGVKLGSMTPTLRIVVTADKKQQQQKKVVLMGLGIPPKPDKLDPWHGFGFAVGKAVATRCDEEKRISSCSVLLPAVLFSQATFLQDFATAFYTALYSDNRYRTGARVKKIAETLKQVTLLPEGGEGDAVVPKSETVAAALDKARKLCHGVYIARDIVNAPHNVLNSVSLADTARRIADESNGTISCLILNSKDCEERGMGAFLGVARGSETEPQFIHLTYKSKDSDSDTDNKSNKKKIGFVGKGLLFDTGGYDIKMQLMNLMKGDCGGAAAVLGAARSIGMLSPAAGVGEVHFITAACENMINEKAYVPSDILTASNGKTIEIGNTDCEGRLTLADALVYADKEVGCDTILELSTLTGAIISALGRDIGGIYSTNDELIQQVEAASKVTADKTWRMPLVEEYKELIESKIADLDNFGTSPWAHSIRAALFLHNFVRPKKAFCHMDIAGPTWSDKTGSATGYGVKLLTEFVLQQGTSDATTTTTTTTTTTPSS